ncbi:MAG: UDP-N-acetylmuramoyl-L-alanyl-D-glutamate--2,6-diaminopimelate ligase [Gammaproteobacteria bacterium]|nr:MAG: UDP-N-acetylmuramoyl-L-alanyl-D-glutamate--2,6-diaminopimelate ligase [Gammaproteobacteria bacterium]
MMAAPASSPGLTLATLLERALPLELDVPVTGVALDSRRVRPGDAFLALAGTRCHGLAHAAEAVARGAVAVLYEPAPGIGGGETECGVPCLAVPGLRARAGALAARLLGEPAAALWTLGVTGTDGKTSCAWFMARALEAAGVRCGLVGTLGAGFPGRLQDQAHTTPDPVRLQQLLAAFRDQGAAAVAMEVSSHALDQQRVDAARIDVAVFTNLGRDHLDYHRTPDAYAAAKARLFALPTVRHRVVNLDDPFGRELAARHAGRGILAYGKSEAVVRRGNVGWVRILAVEPTPTGLELVLDTPPGELRFTSGLLGDFQAWNLAAVAGVLMLRGIEAPAQLAELLAGLHTVPGRMEAFPVPGGPLLVVDYAHTPQALAAALRALRRHVPGRLWCVFGAGGERDVGKRPEMGAAAARLADRVLLTSDNPRGEDPLAILAQIRGGMPEGFPVAIEPDRETAIRRAAAEAGAGDAVLIAGKGHEGTQEIAGERRPFSDRALARALAEEGRS